MTIVFALPGNEVLADQLTARLGGVLGTLEIRQFPDGESYVRLEQDVAGKHVLLACSLAQPDAQALRLIFAADAARDIGARSITLIAPYLAYMRQDHRFRPGEAISSHSFARLLSRSFDRVVTVSPHLHRYRALSELYSIEAIALDASPLLAAWVAANVAQPLLIGPDSESEQWVARVAELAGAPYAVGKKIRSGDRSVSIALPSLLHHQGRQPIIIDDIISSGETMRKAAATLRTAGFSKPICLAVHDLQGNQDARLLAQAVDRVVTTDSVPGAKDAIVLAPLIAAALSIPAHSAATG